LSRIGWHQSPSDFSAAFHKNEDRRKKKTETLPSEKIVLEGIGAALITAVLDETHSLQSYFKVGVETIIINANDIFRK